jgi:toxin ParE1/3/4
VTRRRKAVVHYSKVAEEALDAIAMYTAVEWGHAQRDRYIALLQDACERVVPLHATLARPVPGRPELRTLRCERHVIYFREVEDGFEIVHVLHDRQLPTKHL